MLVLSYSMTVNVAHADIAHFRPPTYGESLNSSWVRDSAWITVLIGIALAGIILMLGAFFFKQPANQKAKNSSEEETAQSGTTTPKQVRSRTITCIIFLTVAALAAHPFLALMHWFCIAEPVRVPRKNPRRLNHPKRIEWPPHSKPTPAIPSPPFLPTEKQPSIDGTD